MKFIEFKTHTGHRVLLNLDDISSVLTHAANPHLTPIVMRGSAPGTWVTVQASFDDVWTVINRATLAEGGIVRVTS